MSHNRERKEKICLNCNAAVYGRYCHVCGQENTEPKESFLHLVNHFIEDISHFDGKFFITIKDLIFKPGFLSIEYLRGRRVSYLHPVRMYIFTSAIFFFFYFAVHHSETESETKKVEPIADTATNHQKTPAGKTKSYHYTPTDSSSHFHVSVGKTNNDFININTDDDDSILNKGSDLISKAGKKIYDKKEQIQHRIPQVMFCTMPLLALVLMWLYRKHKQFFYVSHLIFIIHVLTATYMLLLTEYLLDFLAKHFWHGFFDILSSLVSLLSFYYVYKAMKIFYGQRRLKTFIKCCLLYFFFAIALGIVYSIFISKEIIF